MGSPSFFSNHLLPQTEAWVAQLPASTPTPTGPPSGEFVGYLNALIASLIIADLWYTLDRMWIHATEQQGHATISIVNPNGLNASWPAAIVEVNSPTWAKNVGYTGDGSTTYINTNFNASTGINYLNNDRSASCYSLTNIHSSSASLVFFGAFDGGNGNDVLYSFDRPSTPLSAIAGELSWNGTTTTTAGGCDGLLSICNDGTSAGAVLYRNGSQVGSVSSYSNTTLPNRNMYLLARNNSGTAEYFGTNTMAITIFGGYLNSSEQSTLYTLVQAFATALHFAV